MSNEQQQYKMITKKMAKELYEAGCVEQLEVFDPSGWRRRWVTLVDGLYTKSYKYISVEEAFDLWHCGVRNIEFYYSSGIWDISTTFANNELMHSVETYKIANGNDIQLRVPVE